MDFILSLLIKTAGQVWHTLLANWPYLLASTIIAVLLSTYVKADRVSAFLRRYSQAGIFGATAVAVGTPLCSCGTTAVLIGMMASTIPWGPVVAFMVSSPLTSPQELIYSAGLFGWPFALAFFLASILLGLGGGVLATLIENRGYLAGQARFVAVQCSSCEPVQPVRVEPPALLKETAVTGGRLLLMFLGFASVGYFLNGLIPAGWVAAIFGAGNVYSVPVAATLGLPLYINTESSLPLIRALLDSGMSAGAALAFMISGAGTSLGAISGALTIARWRVVGLVMVVLWVGAMASGYAYDLLVVAGGF